MVALPTGILASGFAQQLKLRTDRYRSEADRALEDGILSDTEILSLENLRMELGISSHTASQILDAEKVRLAINALDLAVCPTCGAVADSANRDPS
jgi:hypothetical protein